MIFNHFILYINIICTTCRKSTESVQKISRTMSSFSSPELYEKFYNEAMVDLENLQSTSSTTGITSNCTKFILLLVF